MARSETHPAEAEAAPKRVGLSEGPVVVAELEPEPDIMCMECGVTFVTARQYRTHRIQKHGFWRDVRFYCTDGICPVCGDDHHCRLRVMRHLERAIGCREAMLAGAIPRLSDEEVAAADAVDREVRKVALRQSRHECCGPPVRRAVA